MATAVQRAFRLTDAGLPVTGQVRTAGAERPAVMVCGAAPVVLGERLARAGLSVVSFDGEGDGALPRVLAALGDGAVGLRPRAVGLLGYGADARPALLRAAHEPAVRAVVSWMGEAVDTGSGAVPDRVAWLELRGGAPALEPAVGAAVEWFGRHLT
jgi:hypothetical protein